MVPSTVVTVERMHQVLRRRLRMKSAVWMEILGEEIPPGSHTKKEMIDPLRAKLQARGDRGMENAIKNLALEPRNPFEPEKRRLLKREVVAIGSLMAMLLGALIWCNFLGR